MKNYSRRNSPEDFSLGFNQCVKKNEYNGLRDPNLSSFFASPNRRKLLIKQRLVIFTQVSQNGLVNDKECSRSIARVYNDNSNLVKLSLTPAPARHKKHRIKIKYSDNEFKKQHSDRKSKLPSIKPVSSFQLREILSKQRLYIKEQISAIS